MIVLSNKCIIHINLTNIEYNTYFIYDKQIKHSCLTVYLFVSHSICRSIGDPGIKGIYDGNGWFSSWPHWPFCRWFLTIVRESKRGLKWKATSSPSE